MALWPECPAGQEEVENGQEEMSCRLRVSEGPVSQEEVESVEWPCSLSPRGDVLQAVNH